MHRIWIVDGAQRMQRSHEYNLWFHFYLHKVWCNEISAAFFLQQRIVCWQTEKCSFGFGLFANSQRCIGLTRWMPGSGGFICSNKWREMQLTTATRPLSKVFVGIALVPSLDWDSNDDFHTFFRFFFRLIGCMCVNMETGTTWLRVDSEGVKRKQRQITVECSDETKIATNPLFDLGWIFSVETSPSIRVTSVCDEYWFRPQMIYYSLASCCYSMPLDDTLFWYFQSVTFVIASI